jgi:hypothetical protein
MSQAHAFLGYVRPLQQMIPYDSPPPDTPDFFPQLLKLPSTPSPASHWWPRTLRVSSACWRAPDLEGTAHRAAAELCAVRLVRMRSAAVLHAELCCSCGLA